MSTKSFILYTEIFALIISFYRKVDGKWLWLISVVRFGGLRRSHVRGFPSCWKFIIVERGWAYNAWFPFRIYKIANPGASLKMLSEWFIFQSVRTPIISLLLGPRYSHTRWISATIVTQQFLESRSDNRPRIVSARTIWGSLRNRALVLCPCWTRHSVAAPGWPGPWACGPQAVSTRGCNLVSGPTRTQNAGSIP